MPEFEYLDVEDLLHLTERLKAGPVRDLGLLKSAAFRPRATALGAEIYPSLGMKTAALLHSVVRNHALVDGNKRLALLAFTVFSDLNGHTIDIDDDSAFDIVMSAAVDELDLAQIAERFGLDP